MSPDASVSSSASSTGLSRHEAPKQLPDLEALVKHFVAAKRSLNTHTVLYSANETVNSARELLEENAVLAARNAAVKNIVHEQADALEAVRRGMHVVQAEIHHDFKVTMSFPSLSETCLTTTRGFCTSSTPHMWASKLH